MALTPETYERIKGQLRFSLSTPGSYAKRNRGQYKRDFLAGVAQQAPGYEWLAELCSVDMDDVAMVAQSVLDNWDGKGNHLAETMAARQERQDAIDLRAWATGR